MATNREREQRSDRMGAARGWAEETSKEGGRTCVSLPEGVEQYKLQPGTHKLDFMLYKVGKRNPRADEGIYHFERSYDAHRIPTPQGTRLYCCRMACFGQPCPVCELAQTSSAEMQKVLRPTTRHLWLVNDKPGDAKNALKVLDTNRYNKGRGFGEQMIAAHLSMEEYRDFAEPVGGLTLQLVVIEESFPGGKYSMVTRIDFLPRKYDYPKSCATNAPCLDEMLVDMGYKKLKSIITQTPEDDDEAPRGATRALRNTDAHEEEERPRNGRVPPRDTSNDDEDDAPPPPKKPSRSAPNSAQLDVGMIVMYEGMECDITRISEDGNTLTVADEDGKIYRGVEAGEVKVVPTKGSGKPAEPPAKTKPSPMDDEDDDMPPPKKARS